MSAATTDEKAIQTIQPIEHVSGEILTVEQVSQRRQKVMDLMNSVMKKDVHYGTVPGCGDKPTLLQPGAQALTLLFNVGPTFEVAKTDTEADGIKGHRIFEVTCRLVNRGTGAVVGEGLGICSTLENKYRYRKSDRKCPNCGKPAVIKGREEYGGGWVCFKKKEGCGAKFADGDSAIEKQESGQVANTNPYDLWNTIQKIACKRALVHAALNLTGASELFTQDIEDGGYGDNGHTHEADAPRTKTVENTAPSNDPVWILGTAGQDGSVRGKVKGTKILRTGEKNGRAWTLYAVRLTDDRAFQTFSQSVYDGAGDVIESGEEIDFHGKHDAKGNFMADYCEVVIVRPAATAQAAPTPSKPKPAVSGKPGKQQVFVPVDEIREEDIPF